MAAIDPTTVKLGDSVVFKQGDVQALAQIIMKNTSNNTFTVSVAGLGQTLVVTADELDSL